MFKQHLLLATGFSLRQLQLLLLVLRPLLMLLYQITPLVVNLSVLQLLSCDLRRNLGKLFHLEGLLVL